MPKYIFLILLLAIFSCKKEDSLLNENQKLSFSNDTIIFDTIFSSIGSITKTLTVYNNNANDIITDIEINGVDAAHFRMNIDGVPGNKQSDIHIPANDSIFIFLEITIDPSNLNTPFILTDSIIFRKNNHEQNVKLVAWGQNAYFHTANTFGEIINNEDTTRFYYHLINENTIWENNKPHVIYGYVIIEGGYELLIEAGSNIHLHKNSGIIVGNPFSNTTGASLQINGNLNNEVIIQGDRLDPWYRDLPGQWDRIWLMPGSINNKINYAIIKNGSVAIHADSVYNNNPTVEISNCIIENISNIGILGQGAHIKAENTIISNCGQYAIACNIGGEYEFNHCTIGNYWSFNNRKNPSILLNNYYEGADGNIYIRNLNKAEFTNCIIDGSLSSEISFDKHESGVFNYHFNHTLVKIDPNINTNNQNYTNVIKNQNPLFKSLNDFHLEIESPAINAGINSNTTNDIEGNIRLNPDLGAYEYQD